MNKYGVGSCGPRGFYGTIDVHLDIEEELAAFFGTEAAIIYSYDVATISSIIPAFANRKDILIIDEVRGLFPSWACHTRDPYRGQVLDSAALQMNSYLPNASLCPASRDAQYCSYPVQAGATVSRAKVYKFKHNDVADLERVIQKAEEEERKKRWVALGE